jgi:RNA polymerase sigma-70 factor (ECF subfamily)
LRYSASGSSILLASDPGTPEAFFVAETSPDFRAEDYRSYLGVLARVHLAKAGFVRNKLDSSDLVQDILLQAHVARTQFRGASAGEFAAWLRRILTNTLLDAERRYGRQKRNAALEESCRDPIEGSASRMLELPAREQTSPSGYVARRERELFLAAALDALPEDQRTAVELRYIGECSLAEIAVFMNRTKPSVAGLIRRGLQDLRVRLKPLH